MKLKIFTILKQVCGMFLLPAFLASCVDKLEPYQPASWLKGSAWQVLEDEGNYSIFLKAIEKTGYKNMLSGKALLTVMAPDDAAFTKYLNQKGYNSIDDMELTDLKKLVTFHLLYYSYSKQDMVNFRPAGDQETEEDSKNNAGLYYKFRTKSSDAPTVEYDRINKKDVTVYHLERFVPVFSYMFFNTKEINAQRNYEYFYPNSTWTGEDGFNVSDASVNEYEIIADNGAVYKLDRVLEPLETIATELNKNSDYSTFAQLYDKFSTYTYDATLSKNYGTAAGTDSLFLHTYDGLAPIAQEWPVTSYSAISTLMSTSYSCFAPNNDAMNNFFKSFWQVGGYESLDKVDPKIIKFLLRSCVFSGGAIFPEEIEKGLFQNKNNEGLNFDPNTASLRKMCSNGTLYGLSSFTTPPLFLSVAGPLFKEYRFRAALYALDGSGLANSFLSKDTKYTLLIPTNDQLAYNGYEIREYLTGNELSVNDPDAGGWTKLDATTMQNLINEHTVSGVAGLTGGQQVLSTQAAFNYLFTDNGKITSSARFNNSILGTENPFSTFTEVSGNWSNGKAYTYNATGAFEPTATEQPDGLEKSLASVQDGNYPYFNFGKLLQLSGLADLTKKTLANLYPNTEKVAHFVVFVPTNNVLNEAVKAGKVPGIAKGSYFDGEDASNIKVTDPEALSTYLKTYFILSNTNVITSYPYPGSAFTSGAYNTDGLGKLVYTDSGTSISIRLEGNSRTCKAVSVSKYTTYPFPYAYNDGCIHFINSTIE